MLFATYRAVILVSLGQLLVLSSAIAAVPFTSRIVDSGFYGDCKAVADFDGDGLVDVAVGSASELRWYRYPSFAATTIAIPKSEFTTDMQAGDVDGDGDADIIVPDLGSAILWFENPRPSGDPATATWPRHVIGTYSWAHDIEVGDIDGNGRLDVLARQSATTLFLQTSPNGWTRVDLSGASPGGEGADLGDIDLDGDLDVALNGYWMECPTDPRDGSAWVKRDIVASWPVYCGVRVTEVDGDGRPDVILVPSESSGRASWFRGPVDPHAAGLWAETVIDPAVEYVHTFQMADVDRNGWLDVVFAEMAQSSGKRVGVFFNDGAGATFSLQVISTSGSHNIRAADFGGDGDIDVMGANWQGPPVEWWENGLCAPCTVTDDLLVGEGLGPSNTNGVRILTEVGTATSVWFQAYGAGRWGTNVASAELNGASDAEILTGPGPGSVYGPHVRAFLRDGTPLSIVNYFAYGTLKFGVNVAGADVDADAFDEVLSGAGPGVVFGPHLRGWNVDGTGVGAVAGVNYFAYGTLKFGVNAARGDVDDDGYAEILTGPGPGSVFGPQVRGWNVDGGSVSSIGGLNFTAFSVTTFGVNVAGGELDGDGWDEIAAAQGPGPTHAADLAGFDHDGTGVAALPGYRVRPFVTLYGARVGLGDLSQDPRRELLAGAGRDPAASARVAIYGYAGLRLQLSPVAPVPFAGGYGVNPTGGTFSY